MPISSARWRRSKAKKHKILYDMAAHARGLAAAAAREPDEPEAMRRGDRLIELPNGEIILRPYGVADQETQVIELDLKVREETGPIVLRMPQLRVLVGANADQDTSGLQLEELMADIDKIYAAKIVADTEAEWIGAPRRELLDFVVEYYLDGSGLMSIAEKKVCSILDLIRCLERRRALPPKVALFARFLEFCEYDKSLPLPMLSMVLQAKRHAQAALMRFRAAHESERNMSSKSSTKGPVKRSGTMSVAAAAGASSRGTRTSFSVAEPPSSAAPADPNQEPMIDAATAYEAGLKALPSMSHGLRELFMGIAKASEIDGQDVRRSTREFYVLMSILQARMQSDQAWPLRDLVHRAEKREAVTQDEFRDAVRMSGVLEVDDIVWRAKLSPTGGTQGPGQISGELLLDSLGGGAAARLPPVCIAESPFLSAVAEAVSADFTARADRLKVLWERRVQERAAADTIGEDDEIDQIDPLGPLGFTDVCAVMISADPELPIAFVRTVFCAAVEASRACMQSENSDRPPLIGTTRPSLNGLYGGEVVTFKMLLVAARRHRLLHIDMLREANVGSHAMGMTGTMRTHGSDGGTMRSPRSAAAARTGRARK